MTTNFDEYYPFASGAGASSSEDRWAVMARLWRTTGVIPSSELTDTNIVNELDVFADSSGRQVKVRDGVVFIKGFVGRINSQKTIALATADPSNPRIDTIVARLDRSGADGIVRLDVLTGTPAGSPVPATLSQNDDIWEIALAYVTVNANASTISYDKVVNVRKMSHSFGGMPTFETDSAYDLRVNTAVIVENDSTQVVLDMPENAMPGDEIVVLGKGAGGWAIRSNAAISTQVVTSGIAGLVAQMEQKTLIQSTTDYSDLKIICLTGGANQVWFCQAIDGAEIELDGNWYGDGSNGDVVINSDTYIASTEDGDGVVMNYRSLTIDEGFTLSVTNRCKLFWVYVKNNCTINGVLSMTKKGANVDPVAAGVAASGLRLPMRKTGSTDTLADADFAGCGTAVIAAAANQPGINGNGKIYVIDRTGSAGGYSGGGSSGANKTGGGGGGRSGAQGGDGTCFSGGSATGGTNGTPVSDYGGPGTDGYATSSQSSCGGGAGNPGGSLSNGESSSGGADGESGTGGVIILIVGGDLTIGAAGKIEANGGAGGGAYGPYTSSRYPGGGSGGGVCLVLHKGALSNNGTVEANGGAAGGGTTGAGPGGNGWVCIEQVD